MTGDLIDELAFSARQLEHLANALSELAVRIRGTSGELGGRPARACAEWIAALDVDTGTASQLASDTRRAAHALEVYTGLPAELREHAEAGMWAPDPEESPLVRILRILAALFDGGADPVRSRGGADPSVWSPWSPPVRAGSGPRLAGTDGERAGTEQGIRVAELPDSED